MKCKYLLPFFLTASLYADSQTKINNKISFADTVKKYFDYKSLNEAFCNDVPPGIYAMSFRVNKNHIPYDFEFSNDSLKILKLLFVNVIKSSAKKTQLRKNRRRYLQLFYFNIILNCNSINDTTKISNNIYSDLSKLLSSQLSAIETSFQKIIKYIHEYRVLESIIINDFYSNNWKNEKGFRNDIKKNSKSKDELESLIKKVKNELE